MFLLITSRGTIMKFSVKACADIFCAAYGGVIIPKMIDPVILSNEIFYS